MSNHSKIKSKPYRNWVRGALGLFYLQKGLYPFVDRVIIEEHAKIVQNLTPCTSCAIEDILPAHASGKVCLQTNKARCNCKKRKNRNCATCSKIYDEIVLQHRFRDPHWVTDCSTWYNDHWQFAKCFLTTTSKGSNNTAAETDASGLLSIIINGEFFQSEIQCNIDPPNDSFSKVREIRNEILHNSTLDIADHDLTRYLQSMIAVLEDKKTLCLDQAAQAAALKLKEILRDNLIITTNDEACAIQTALNAIKVAKEQSEESIKVATEQSEESIKVAKEQSEESIKVAKEQSEESIRKLAEETQNTTKASEEGIRKLTEKSRNSLQQQTLESNTGINEAEKHAIENLASTVSTEFEKTYEPEIRRLKVGHEDHENRLKTIEKEQQILQMKLIELENQVAGLKAAEERHQTRIKYLKQKQGLQQYLVEEYQRHTVKTSIAPLMTRQNTVSIRDVYVSPRMVVEENEDDNNGNTIISGNGRETNKKHIERYRDLFNTDEKRNQKIFVVGDVGTGKSSFCKMMMQNWCSSITKRIKIDESSVKDEGEVLQGEERNMFDMNQFDFLFYIPLCEMPNDIDDTVDMIKAQLEKYTTLIDNIFTNDSERCLILADGLDEWTPPKLKKQSLHHGKPTSRLAGDSTILTTSRPSSSGILDMKSSEYDLKVTILGVMDSSVQPMIKQYMTLLNKTSAVTTFHNTLSELSFKDIHNAPMLLQQIIWLYCNNYDISHSRSSIYLHIVNAVLGWVHERKGLYPKLQSNSFEQLPLPKSFDKYPRCQENRELLLLLGKIAYDAYITRNDSSLVFGRYKLKQLGVSAEDIDAILQTGILTEVNCADPTYENSRLSFIHTSYVEFFAALYICSCYLFKIASAHSSVTPLIILEGLIAVTPETPVNDILRLENVLIMICGLVPCLTEHVCECIYKLTPRAGNMNEHWVEYQIQCLTFDCLSEHISNDQQTIKFKLRHINLDPCSNRSEYLSDLVPSSIETCRFSSFQTHEHCSLLSSFLSQAVSLQTLEMFMIFCTEDECEGHIINCTNQRELQSIKLSLSNISVFGINHTVLQSFILLECRLSHEQCTTLSSCLSQTVSLETLELSNVECLKPECEGHCIDISGQNHLRDIQISGCDNIFLSGVNRTCLTSCFIDKCKFSHAQCSFLSSLVSQAESLHILFLSEIKCIEDRCTGHVIDVSNHKQLERLHITYCNMIFITGIHPTCPMWCVIRNCNILQHGHCTSLCTSLTQAESLHDISLGNIECIEKRCAGHVIDLTNHKQLHSIQLSQSNILVSGINRSVQSFSLFDCRFSHEQCSKLSSFVSQATSLETLMYSNVECIKPECEGHCIDISNQNQFRHIWIYRCDKILLSGVNLNCLTFCCISECTFSHKQCSFLSSFVSQAESLDKLMLGEIKCIENRCTGHVIDLTNHKQLHSLSISKCNMISITGINATCAMSSFIRNCNLSHEQCTSLCTFLSQAESLYAIDLDDIKCIDNSCAGHVIDLTNHKQLESLFISNCNMISITGINATSPMSSVIRNCNLSHEHCTSLCTFLSQAESLHKIDLDNIKCIDNRCAGHVIDLTKHKQLESSSIKNCNTISDAGIYPTCPVSMKISNCNQ